MPAQYIVRLDDACPTMERRKWGAVEQLLNEYGIRPIVAVVSANADPELMVDTPDPEFWRRVRKWQDKGWAIAMHGYAHAFHATSVRQILPFYTRSEFSGLPYEVQAEKICKAWSIFDNKRVKVDAWIAPAHCFDHVTLDALRAETKIRVISDGIAIRPFCWRGFSWVPQQLWKFQERPTGVWTVCLHPNMMDEAGVESLGRQIKRYKERIIDFQSVAHAARRKSLADHLFHTLFWLKRRNPTAAVSWQCGK